MSKEGTRCFQVHTNGGLSVDDDSIQTLVMKTIHWEITEDFDSNFFTQVKSKKEEENLDWTSAIDSVRVDNLVARLGDANSAVFYLLQHWDYEPQLFRFLKILMARGANIQELRDVLGNTPLHLAAAGNYVTVAEILLDTFPEMLMKSNDSCDLAVETAIRNRKDDAASFLVRKMTSKSVRDLFHGEGSTKAKLIFTELVHNETGQMRKTILAVLDCTIIPKWTRLPSLLSEDVSCRAWEALLDPPTHFDVSYEALESDDFGRLPSDPMYKYCTKSSLYYLARYCRQSLDKELMTHPTMVLINNRKWNKYAAFWFKVRSFNYVIYLVSIVIMCTTHGALGQLTTKWAGLMAISFLLDESTEFMREPREYWKDPFNYLDIASNVMTLVTSVIIQYRSHNTSYWTMASFTFLLNALCIFKFSVVSRMTGCYTRVLGQVLVKDLPRFLGVFSIIFSAFLFSYLFAVKSYREEDYPTETFVEMLLNRNFTRGTIGQSARCGNWMFCIFLSAVNAFTHGSPFSSNAEETGVLGALIALFFGLSASVVMTNILIAQLNHSYEIAQEYSQLAACAQFLHSVALVEWQLRFKFWRPRVKYYQARETVTYDRMMEFLALHRKGS